MVITTEEYNDDLYEMLRRFTDDNVKMVASWVVERTMKKDGTDAKIREAQDLVALQEIASRPVPLLPSAKKRFWDEVEARYRESSYYDRFSFFNNRMYRSISDRDNSGLKMTINEKLWELPKEIVDGSHIEKRMSVYLSDTQELISDLVEILEEQYDERVTQTRVAIAKYLEPHKSALSKLQKELGQVEDALRKITGDCLVSAQDKESIVAALREKQKELAAMKAREIGNMRGVKAFVDEIRTAQATFDAMIALLERKNAESKARKDYLALISKLDAKIPKLNDIFLELSAQLKKDIGGIRDAFFLLNMSVKQDLIKSLEDQTVLNAILGTMGEGVAERIASAKEGLDARDEAVYDIDLSFLDSRKRPA